MGSNKWGSKEPFHIIDINWIVNFFVHFHVINFLTKLKHFIDFSRCTQVVNSRMHTSGKVLGHCKHRNHLILNQCISKYGINRNSATLVSLFNNLFYALLCQWCINTLYKHFFSFQSDSPWPIKIKASLAAKPKNDRKEIGINDISTI